MKNNNNSVEYWDGATQSTQTGYVIDGQLYTDPEGTQSASARSHWQSGNGQVYVDENGGTISSDDYWAQWEAQQQADYEKNGFAMYDSEGNYQGQAPYAVVKSAMNGGSSGGGRSGDSSGLGYGTGYGTDATAEAYIQQIYDQQMAANQAALENAYELNVNTIEAQKELLPETYQAAKNATAAQAEVQRGNFNEYAAASGLTSGAGGQAQLSMSNELQGNLSSIDKAQANALAHLDLQMTNLTTQYQNDLAIAFAEGNMAKVAALYESYENNKAALMAQQQFEANMAYNYAALDASKQQALYNQALQTAMLTGDFSGMAAFGWTPEWIAAASKQWHDERGMQTDGQ